MEENKETNNEEIIKVIKEEYEKKIAELELQHKEEIDKIRKEEHEKTISTIRAMMSGKQIENSENPAPEKELSFEEQLILDTREKLGLKGGN